MPIIRNRTRATTTKVPTAPPKHAGTQEERDAVNKIAFLAYGQDGPSEPAPVPFNEYPPRVNAYGEPVRASLQDCVTCGETKSIMDYRPGCKTCRRCMNERRRLARQEKLPNVVKSLCIQCETEKPVAEFRKCDHFMEVNAGHALVCNPCVRRIADAWCKSTRYKHRQPPYGLRKEVLEALVKTCTKCHKHYAIMHFYASVVTADGLDNVCAHCRSSLSRQWYRKQLADRRGVSVKDVYVEKRHSRLDRLKRGGPGKRSGLYAQSLDAGEAPKPRASRKAGYIPPLTDEIIDKFPGFFKPPAPMDAWEAADYDPDDDLVHPDDLPTAEDIVAFENTPNAEITQ